MDDLSDGELEDWKAREDYKLAVKHSKIGFNPNTGKKNPPQGTGDFLAHVLSTSEDYLEDRRALEEALTLQIGKGKFIPCVGDGLEGKEYLARVKIFLGM